MTDYEKEWDLSLRIQTCGRDALGADEYHHPYEPTPYSVLERLADSGLISKDDVALDYGCGKGRVGFFLSYRKSAKSIGIEYDDRIYQGDVLVIENAREQIKAGSEITVLNKNTGKQFVCELDVSDRQKAMLFAGGLLDYVKENN